MAAILNSAMFNLASLDSAILVFLLKLTSQLPRLVPTICINKLYSFILSQFDDGSNLELCHHGFIHLSKKKTSLMHSDSTWWWQPSWILPCWIQKLPSWIHSDSIWWWQPSWILPCWIQKLPSWIQTLCYLLSDLLKNTLTPLWLWLKLIQFDSNSFILTQLDDGSHLEFCHVGIRYCHLGFRHLVIFSQIHPLTLAQDPVPNIWHKLIQSDSNSFILTLIWWWQLSWNLPFLIQPFCTKKTWIHSFLVFNSDDGSYPDTLSSLDSATT